jgi:hypothetical protein
MVLWLYDLFHNHRLNHAHPCKIDILIFHRVEHIDRLYLVQTTKVGMTLLRRLQFLNLLLYKNMLVFEVVLFETRIVMYIHFLTSLMVTRVNLIVTFLLLIYLNQQVELV